MSCLKILVILIFAQCRGRSIYTERNGFQIKQHGIYSLHPLASGQDESAFYAKSVIQKRASENEPLKVELPPAPVVENVEEKEEIEALSSIFGFRHPEVNFPRVPLTRTIGQGLNTNIQESLQRLEVKEAETPPSPPAPVVQGELFEGLPARAEEPAQGPIVETESVPLLVLRPNNPPPQETPPQQEAPQQGLGFNRSTIRQYAVYAGDVILKYLSQFFNRARITFNRITNPPPPTPV